jgi:putative drug exporter of the RND superfamily
MSAIARWCFGHRSAVIAAWVLVLVGLGSLSQAVKSDYNDSFSLPGTGSATAQQLLAKAIPAQAGDSDTIVWQVGERAIADGVTRLTRAVSSLREGMTLPAQADPTAYRTFPALAAVINTLARAAAAAVAAVRSAMAWPGCSPAMNSR